MTILGREGRLFRIRDNESNGKNFLQVIDQSSEFNGFCCGAVVNVGSQERSVIRTNQGGTFLSLQLGLYNVFFMDPHLRLLRDAFSA